MKKKQVRKVFTLTITATAATHAGLVELVQLALSKIPRGVDRGVSMRIGTTGKETRSVCWRVS